MMNLLQGKMIATWCLATYKKRCLDFQGMYVCMYVCMYIHIYIYTIYLEPQMSVSKWLVSIGCCFHPFQTGGLWSFPPRKKSSLGICHPRSETPTESSKRKSTHQVWKRVENSWLVVEPTHSEKYARQIGNLPQFSGWKLKNIWVATTKIRIISDLAECLIILFRYLQLLQRKHVRPNKDLPHRRKKVFSMYRKKTKTSNQTSMGIELRFGFFRGVFFSKPNFCTNVRCLKRFQLTSQRNQESFANVASQKSLNKFYLWTCT